MHCESTLTTDGYRNYKYAASKEHLARYSTWKEKIKRSEMGKEIISLVNTEAIEKNCYYFSTLIDIVVFLATHQLVFRGKIDALESEDKGRNEVFLIAL